MAQIKFGKSQLTNPTPDKVANAINIVSAISGVLVTWVSTAPFISNDISNVISSILGLVIALSLALKPFFGVHTDTTDTDNSDNQNNQ